MLPVHCSVQCLAGDSGHGCVPAEGPKLPSTGACMYNRCSIMSHISCNAVPVCVMRAPACLVQVQACHGDNASNTAQQGAAMHVSLFITAALN